jgi:multidrug transporter EmrE-like cation transporter
MLKSAWTMSAIFLALTVAFTVAGQLLVKWGMVHAGGSLADIGGMPNFVWRVFTNWRVLLGMAAAMCAALSWTVAISRIPLSVAYPFTALAVVIVLALGAALFEETVPWTRWLGVLVVCVGVWIASRP